MREDEVILKLQTGHSIQRLIPLSSIRTQDEKKKMSDHTIGLDIGYTESEWAAEYAIPSSKVYYEMGFSPTMVYYDPQNIIPIYIRLHIYGRKILMHSSQSKSEWEKGILRMAKKLEKPVSNKELYSYLMSLDGLVRMEILTEYIKNTEPSADLYDIAMYFYKSTDYGFTVFTQDIWKHILSGKSESQTENTQKAIRHLPDPIPIFRGEGDKSTPYQNAYSWTIDLNCANFFACRLGTANRIVKGVVARKDVLEAFLNEDSEQEVILYPENVKKIHVEKLFTAETSPVVPFRFEQLYQGYRNIIKQKYQGENGHDAAHVARVLFLALCIVQTGKIKLNDEELIMLADACAYHDIGRRNDGIDAAHGERSCAIYSQTHPTNWIPQFCIHFHCLDDDVALQALASNTNIRAKSRAKLIFNILKDADALDRVRFGFRDLDVNYLRLPISHRLVFVAHQALRGIRV